MVAAVWWKEGSGVVALSVSGRCRECPRSAMA